MTKYEAVKTVIIDSNKSSPDDNTLQSARNIISEAISDGYILVNENKLRSFLNGCFKPNPEMATSVFNELTE